MNDSGIQYEPIVWDGAVGGNRVAIYQGRERNFPFYLDGTPVDYDNPRACDNCGRHRTPEGHDACLGTLPNVTFACCGHGDVRFAYLVEDGRTTRGVPALQRFSELNPDFGFSTKAPEDFDGRTEGAEVIQLNSLLRHSHLPGGDR